jgi:hypothetical protein
VTRSRFSGEDAASRTEIAARIGFVMIGLGVAMASRAKWLVMRRQLGALTMSFKDDPILSMAPLAPPAQIPVTGGPLKRDIATTYNRVGGLMSALAMKAGIPVEGALAVWQAESGGLPYTQGRPVLRFENHVFFDEWGDNHVGAFDQHFQFGGRAGVPGRRWQNHRWQSSAGGAWQTFHGSQTKEYNVFQFAHTLAGDPEPGCRASSLGGPQILGRNHATVGYASAKALFDAMALSERWEVCAFFDFCRSKHIIDEIKNEDWEGFAYYYNGAGNAVVYGQKIENYYNAALDMNIPAPGAAVPAPTPGPGPVASPAPPAPMAGAGAPATGTLTAAPAAFAAMNNDDVIERGDKGADVGALQKWLSEFGYYKGALDGIFGGGTEIAVMDFQRDALIDVDGRAGPETLAKLSSWTPTTAADAKTQGRADVVYKNQHSIRNRPCTANLEMKLSTAVYDVYGPGCQAQIYSGGQPRKGMPGKRTGSIRHDDYGEGGRALDVWIINEEGRRLTGPELGKLGQYWLALNHGGCGLEMAVGGIHLDEWETPPPGGGMYWTYPYLNSQAWGDKVRKMLVDGSKGSKPKLHKQ